MWKRVGQFDGQHLEFVVVDVVVGGPGSCPLVQIVVVEVFAQPLQSGLNVRVIVHQPGLDVLMEFNVVDAVAQHASFGDDRPTQPSFLVRIDDGLAGKSRSVRWVVVSNPHGELPFAGS